MTKRSPQPKEGFEITWVIDQPPDEHGDCDPDLWVYGQAYVADHDEAIALAKKQLAVDCIGETTVTPYAIVPYEPGWPGTYLEVTGDTEYITADEEKEK